MIYILILLISFNMNHLQIITSHMKGYLVVTCRKVNSLFKSCCCRFRRISEKNIKKLMDCGIMDLGIETRRFHGLLFKLKAHQFAFRKQAVQN